MSVKEVSVEVDGAVGRVDEEMVEEGVQEKERPSALLWAADFDHFACFPTSVEELVELWERGGPPSSFFSLCVGGGAWVRVEGGMEELGAAVAGGGEMSCDKVLEVGESGGWEVAMRRDRGEVGKDEVDVWGGVSGLSESDWRESGSEGAVP